MIASFPSRDSSRAQVTLTFDSVGNLVRYSERRGRTARFRVSGPNAPSDSVILRQLTANRSTLISLDYAADRAVATNMGGDKPTESVSGSVRALEALEALGPPKAHLQKVRRLCSV